MTDIVMSSDLKCTLIQTNASDEFVIHTARVSAAKGFGVLEALPENLDQARFIRALMDPRHGVPFEHNIFTFFVEVPIFVARQWVKHRISSMNEMSGRYTKMLPKFYTAPAERPLFNVGTKMKPKFEAAPDYVMKEINGSDRQAALSAWRTYQHRLDMGIAEEYARTILPLHTYTQFYWSVNARSIMNFLERRVSEPMNRVETHPQWEIDFAARQLEQAFAETMPLTWDAWVDSYRVAP